MVPLMMFVNCWIFLLAWRGVESTAARTDSVQTSEGLLLYTDILRSDTHDSLTRLRKTSLSFYEFAYDSIAGRRQLGILPKEAAKHFPDAVEVVNSYTFPPKEKGEEPTVVPNFPIVDKSTLFMHGIAALQELVKGYDDTLSTLKSVESQVAFKEEELQRLRSSLDMDVSDKIKEVGFLSAAEIKREEALERLRIVGVEEDAKMAAILAEEERKVLQFQEDMTIARLEKEKDIAAEAAERVLRAERDQSERSETSQLELKERLQEKRSELEQELVIRRSEGERAKIKAESDAKIAQERAAEQIAIRRIQAKGQQDSERAMQSIRLVFRETVALINEVMSSPTRVAQILGVLLALFATYYILREVISLLRDFVQSQIGKPSLVRETSHRMSLLGLMKRPFVLLIGSGWRKSVERNTAELNALFQDVILGSALKERIIQLALSTRNTSSSGAPYRHLLLHGPPGTGKTLIARTLAESSGMDYAIMSGGDVGPLGGDAVNQLHKLFRWANTSEKGLLIFIDEAEAFLNARDQRVAGDGEDSIHRRHALNALLYQTGTQSKKLLLVLATNRPEDLDQAVVDRMDASLLIDIPDKTERVKLCSLYMREHVQKFAESKARRGFFGRIGGSMPPSVDKACMTENYLHSIAEDIKGFSGREISKLFIAAQHSMLLASDGKLTKALMDGIVASKLTEHRAQGKWQEK